MIKNKWDITNRPHTQDKLKILEKVFGVWVKIWNAQNWTDREWYVLDLFAGQGFYLQEKKEISGSSLIMIEEVITYFEKLLKNNIKIKLFLVEKSTKNFKSLKNRVREKINKNKEIRQVLSTSFYNDDCNKAIDKILKKIPNNKKCPLFSFIDPTGLQIKKGTLKKILRLSNPKDIFLNYIQEGVERVGGLANKENLRMRELKAIDTLRQFLGPNVSLIPEKDRKKLVAYTKLFKKSDMITIAYDMPCPHKNDVLYYLLYICGNREIPKIIQDIYDRAKKSSTCQKSIFKKNYFHTFKPDKD